MMRRKRGGADVRCSFCNRQHHEVKKLLSGPGVYICNECVTHCGEILAEELQEDYEEAEAGQLPPPIEIKEKIDEYVIGQEVAKRIVSVAVYNHYRRIEANQKMSLTDDVELEKSNILFIGPTGTGKTLIAQTLARFLNVPFAIVDATTLTEAGYVGDDVETILVRLLQAADYNLDKAQRGIVFIDEIDKISRRADSPSITRDVSGEGVQQGLLKILEGTVASIPPQGGRKHPQQKYVEMDTRNILFICGGAFDGLEKVIENRIGKKTLGFASDLKTLQKRDLNDVLPHVECEDLLKYGLIPELIGRLPVLATLNSLDRVAMLKILTEPKNALVKQYKKYFQMEGVELIFTSSALEAIVDLALKRKTGARGLRAIMEKTLVNIMYELPSMNVQQCRITPDVVLKGADPIYIPAEDLNQKAA